MFENFTSRITIYSIIRCFNGEVMKGCKVQWGKIMERRSGKGIKEKKGR
jgi:hypothetical protein